MRTPRFLPVFLCLFLLGLNVLALSAAAQSTAAGEWTWMGGSSTIGSSCSQGVFCGQPGVYGALGTPSAGNIPGSRSSASSWTDNSGNLWLFGGAGFDSKGNDFFLNDLWEFNPSTSEWTWMGGSSTVNQSGIYGALGTPAAQNIPGGRSSSVSWTDRNGHFWLFGGWGMDGDGFYSALNDLWEFNPSTNEWAWMGGSSKINQPSVNGALGTPSPGNVPGGLYEGTGWTDSSGHLWLLGGLGYDSKGDLGYPDDLWEFDPLASEWTWMGGSSTLGDICANGMFCGSAGVYGTLGAPGNGNLPGSRNGALSWTDSNGNLWLFFGIGYHQNGAFDELNDVWKFKPSANEWAWMGGSSSCAVAGYCANPGAYGTLGSAVSGNLPGSRDSATTWTDSGGHLWLFGGEGYDSNRLSGLLNDLWEFDPSSGEWAWMGGSNTVGTYNNSGGHSGHPGVYGTLETPAFGNLPGGRAWASSWADGSGHLWLFGGEGFDQSGNWGYLNDLWEYQPSSTSFPAADFSVAASPVSFTISSGKTATETVTVTPVNGFNAAVSFACTGLPTGASCSFSPATVTPAGGTASTTLTLTAPTTLGALRRSSFPLLPGASLAVAIGLFGFKRRRFQVLLLLVLSATGLGILNGCGSGGAAGGGSNTPPQSLTSTVTVTATSGALSHAATFTVTVN